MSSGDLVLVHPYGYATTVRRAQGASLDMGCIYFDQKKRAAGRGYGYVAVSRFKSREGCFLYGKLRQTDFLPAGEDMESEILERGILFETTATADEGRVYVGMGSDPTFPIDDLDPAMLAHDPDFED